MPEITIAVAGHSGYGHTARQAEAVVAGANSVAEHTLAPTRGRQMVTR